MSEKIYVASMNLRGTWALPPKDAVRVNVTSAQSRSSLFRLELSPMNIKVNNLDGKEYFCFENYWQAGKRYEGLDDAKSLEKQSFWWKSQTSGKRRYPLGKGRRVTHAVFPGFESLDYIDSRKKVYVPLYIDAVKSASCIKLLQETSKTKSIVVYDFDGPRDENGMPTCLEMTDELFREKLNDPTHPFGHGYIVAALIKGMDVLKLL